MTGATPSPFPAIKGGDLLRRILLAALIAGALGGLFVSVLQEWKVVPLILAAEQFEGSAAHDHAGGGTAGHDHGEGWAPGEGVERKAFTAGANLVTGIGFALLLVAAFALSGRPVDAREGLFWGLAGFASFTAAPALGLPPELPGMVAADLPARQVWWITTASCTAGGLALLAFARGIWFKLAALVLIVLPHILSAPRPAAHGGSVPPELAAEFVIASLATAAAFWLVLGALAGAVYRRLGREA